MGEWDITLGYERMAGKFNLLITSFFVAVAILVLLARSDNAIRLYAGIALLWTVPLLVWFAALHFAPGHPTRLGLNCSVGAALISTVCFIAVLALLRRQKFTGRP
jgi:hypothetical protein